MWVAIDNDAEIMSTRTRRIVFFQNMWPLNLWCSFRRNSLHVFYIRLRQSQEAEQYCLSDVTFNCARHVSHRGRHVPRETEAPAVRPFPSPPAMRRRDDVVDDDDDDDDDAGVAKKTCTANGTWYMKNALEWTDYRHCLDKQVSGSAI